MSPVFDLSSEESRGQAFPAAKSAVGEGKLIVLPTDTVYGIGADAFTPDAVAALLEAKGRGREMPPPVLIGNPGTVDGLAMNVPSYARRLIDRFWPGGLTLIFRAQPSLMWDLGDTNGTVALRMPNDADALALLEQTGPLAVSSANRTGHPTATTITEAGFAFGPAVEVYLDGGSRTGNEPSTILDCTKADPVMLRLGAISVAQLRDVLGPIDLLDATGAPLSEHPSDQVEQAVASASEGESSAAETSDAEAQSQGSHAVDVQAAESHEPAAAAGGVGAEPPFEREPFSRVELPGRSDEAKG